MKKTVKVASVILSLVMALGLSACGGGNSKTVSKKDTKNMVPFHTSMWNKDKIVTDGEMPETFKLISHYDQEDAKKVAKEKGEEYTPEYEFVTESGVFALVGPDYVLESGTDSFSFHTSIDYEKEHGKIEPKFADYKEFRETNPSVSKFYPLLKKDFKIDGRDALIYKLTENDFAIAVDIDDYGAPCCYVFSLIKPKENKFKSTDEILDFIENDAEFNAIINSIKFTIKQ